MNRINSVTVIIDLNESDWRGCCASLRSAFGKGVTIDMVYLDMLHKRGDSPSVVSVGEIIHKDEFNIFGYLKKQRNVAALSKYSDMLICLAERKDRRVERLVRECRSRFKIGRTDIKGHPFDLLMQTPPGRTISQAEALKAFLELQNNVQWK